MARKIGEMLATDYLKFEFEREDQQLKKEAVLVRASWWNSYHGDWESSHEQILIPVDKIDEFIRILDKARNNG